jgi:hypothetical protein
MSTITLLFDEAWLRRRRRRRREVAVWTLAAVLVVLVMLGLRPLAVGSTGDSGIQQLSSRALVRSGSYLAIHCPQPNSIACDQLALAVTLKRPARTASVTIDGHTWPMNRWGDQLYRSSRPRRVFDGYLSHAGIRSRLHGRTGPGDLFINDARSAGIRVAVKLLVELPSGRLVSTRLRLYLADGWG